MMLPDSADVLHLYYLWEQDQWEAGSVDLSVDAEQWERLDPTIRRVVMESLAWRRERATVGMTALVLFVDLAPKEEQQVFLTTQLVDEARHLVFFDRVLTEVWKAASVVDHDPRVAQSPAVVSLVREVLPEVVHGLTGARDVVGLVTALTTYSVVVEGALGLTDHWAVARFLEAHDLLPGICAGFEREATAARRHVAFAGALLADVVRDRPQLADVAADAVTRCMPLVRRGLEALAATAPMVYEAREVLERAGAAADPFKAGRLDLPVTE